MGASEARDAPESTAAEAPLEWQASIHAFNAMSGTGRVRPRRACQTRAPSPINMALTPFVQGSETHNSLSLHLALNCILSL
jgi:hypothetical protein